jgi:hypothetical protein
MCLFLLSCFLLLGSCPFAIWTPQILGICSVRIGFCCDPRRAFGPLGIVVSQVGLTPFVSLNRSGGVIALLPNSLKMYL